MDVIEKDIAKLHQNRLRRDELKRMASAVKEAMLSQSAELRAIEEELETICKDIEYGESSLRGYALAAYSSSGNKKPFAGVEVKVFKVRSFTYDPNSAKRWCLSNLTPALKLDAKTFEKAIESGDVPAEVATMEETEEPRAQIATDLGKFLGTE